VGALTSFAGLSDEAVADLAASAQLIAVPSGQALFRQGEPAGRYFVLADGRVRLTQVTPDGQQVVVRFITPGEGIGIVAAIVGGPYPLTAEAVEAALAFSWDGPVYKELMERHAGLGARTMQMLAQRVQEFQDRSRELATERVERRLARALLRLASQSGRRIGDTILIELPISRQDIAEMSGTTVFSASRVLAAWSGAGIVAATRLRVEILQPHLLVAIAEDLPRPE
jgi:CRP-like cAMP-binding protein